MAEVMVICKYQKDDNDLYKLPENVLAFASRLNITRAIIPFMVNMHTSNDPSLVEILYCSQSFGIYKEGQALYIDGAYTKKFGISSISKIHQ
ncbi:MAG: hypothetical protein IPP34_09425 [Bacteroidetes bacterium]|nr:hypothetical protein [Bacteroidota bacterium]